MENEKSPLTYSVADRLAPLIAEWADRAQTVLLDGVPFTTIACAPEELRRICSRLMSAPGYRFATLVVEDAPTGWQLHYLFHGNREDGLFRILLEPAAAQPQIPSISGPVHAVDWHERETEDLFGLFFEGHPRLGDFVLHEQWPEGINPMRTGFDAASPFPHREIDPQWRPVKIVQAPGAFTMPIGPVFSDHAEAAHFLQETVGEDVIRVIPRFFYKYRGIEKLAEGRTIEETLLLVERFSGTSAFAHGLAFCQAVESIGGISVPPRTEALRVLLAELERMRHHVAVIAEICGSTGLAVATSQAAILEEALLRCCGEFTGHRYLFGLNVPGGLSTDLATEACRTLYAAVNDVAARLAGLQEMLRFSSSFLDRIEEVGAISFRQATDHGLVGPVARASGVLYDLRNTLPYARYRNNGVSFRVPFESEGDGYARLRVFFSEAAQSAQIIEQVTASLPPGAIRCRSVDPVAGAALGWVEAPRGAAFHWVRLDTEGRVRRLRITPPSFTNWHGFHLAAENFAFQDFPIIMATFGLSNAECDR